MSAMKHLLTLTDYESAEIQHILDLAVQLQETGEPVLKNKHVLFVFEKPSLRTLLGTEVAINQLGGHVIHSSPDIMLSKGKNVQFSCRESMKDTVLNVSQWCDAIFARVFSHDTLSEMAELSPIPVVNALCEKYHPMQALADVLTIQEHFGKDKHVTLTFVGDANNVACSIFECLLKLGNSVRWTGPAQFGWNQASLTHFQTLAALHGGSFEWSTNPDDVLPGSDIVYTDTFVSMGEEDIAESKIPHFVGYQVNKEMMQKAGNDVVFMHCQPAHRGVEVTNEVMDAPLSLVQRQAFNRMVSAKGVFAALLQDANIPAQKMYA